VAAIAISTGVKINGPLRIPFSFPTYVGILFRAAAGAARDLKLQIGDGHAGLEPATPV